jgi:hypothetical protein
VTWPVLAIAALVAVSLRCGSRPRQAQALALLVTVVALGYAWIGLGKV